MYGPATWTNQQRIGSQSDLVRSRHVPRNIHQPESGHRMPANSLSGDGNQLRSSNHLHREFRQMQSGGEMAGQRFGIRHVDAVGACAQWHDDVGFRFLQPRVMSVLLNRQVCTAAMRPRRRYCIGCPRRRKSATPAGSNLRTPGRRTMNDGINNCRRHSARNQGDRDQHHRQRFREPARTGRQGAGQPQPECLGLYRRRHRDRDHAAAQPHGAGRDRVPAAGAARRQPGRRLGRGVRPQAAAAGGAGAGRRAGNFRSRRRRAGGARRPARSAPRIC